MRAPKHNADYYRDWWLKKFHNTNADQVVKDHPEEAKSGQWFKLYPVTEAQYREWRTWAEKEVMKDCKISKSALQHYFWSIELDCAPNVINEK